MHAARVDKPITTLRSPPGTFPGFFVSLLAFVILITLVAVSIGTIVIWVGALLLPLTLST